MRKECDGKVFLSVDEGWDGEGVNCWYYIYIFEGAGVGREGDSVGVRLTERY